MEVTMGIVDDHEPAARRQSPGGLRPNSEVIIALQSLIEDRLGGFAYDLMPGEFDPRLPVGGVAGLTTRHPGEQPRPCVFVRAALPSAPGWICGGSAQRSRYAHAKARCSWTRTG